MRSQIAVSFAVLLLIGCGRPASDQPVTAPQPLSPPVAALPVLDLLLVSERVVDERLETQIVQHFALVGNPSKQEVQAELASRLEQARSRGGFRYHQNPSGIGIFIYRTEAQAKAGTGAWFARAVVNPGGDPTIEFDDRRFAGSSDPIEKYGKSEEERQAIYRQLLVAEDRAEVDAAKGKGTRGELRDKYWAALAKKHGLSDDQLTSIAGEAYIKGWTR